MFFKFNSRACHFSLQFYKFYITRLSFVLSRHFARHQFMLRLRNRRNLLFAASLAGFSFRAVGTLDDEFVKIRREYRKSDPFSIPDQNDGWERVYCNEQISVYRRRLKGREDIFEYRCIGTYSDISPNDFVTAQKDVDYRLEWDKNVKSLDVLEQDPQSGAQVVRWESKYPYPMQPRLYIFLRRQFVDRQRKQIAVLCRALDQDTYPDSSQTTVRVIDYESTLLVRAHRNFDENGLDFLLAYYDDTRAPIPRKIYQFGVNVIGPNFLMDAHNAALKLATSRKDNSQKRVFAGAE